MAQNNEESLNEEITEFIIELDNIYPKREEETRNCPLNVVKRVIREYDGLQRI